MAGSSLSVIKRPVGRPDTASDAAHSQPDKPKGDDWISTLPLEIFIQIAEHLDPEDIVRSQRVSKRWRTVFSSDAVLKDALHQTLAFLGLESAKVSVADAMSYFRWRHGLQCARPVKKLFIPWPDSTTHGIICHSRRLCYGTWGSSNVTVLDLDSGKRITWADGGYDHLQNFLIMSDRYVVLMMDRRNMIAWDTRTSTRQIKQLPCIINQIAIEKDKVVIFGHNPSVIYIWDLSADQIRVLGAYGQRFLWHLDVDGGILVVFESVYAGLKHLTEMQVQQTKWTLTGKLLDKK